MLEVRGLTKLFSGIPAVQDVSFAVKPYEVLGYLGPNGSGKSTTAKILTGLLQPSRGQVLFEGKNIQSNLVAFKKRLGFFVAAAAPVLWRVITYRNQLLEEGTGFVFEDKAEPAVQTLDLSS